jgi:hypothetical protein
VVIGTDQSSIRIPKGLSESCEYLAGTIVLDVGLLETDGLKALDVVELGCNIPVSMW